MQVATRTEVLQVKGVHDLPKWAPNEQAFAADCLSEESHRRETRVYNVHGHIIWTAPSAMHVMGSSSISWAPNSSHLLCECRTQPLVSVYKVVDPLSGSILCSITPPDFQGFNYPQLSPDSSMVAICSSSLGRGEDCIAVHSCSTGVQLWSGNGRQAWWHLSSRCFAIWDVNTQLLSLQYVPSGERVAICSFQGSSDTCGAWDSIGRRLVLATSLAHDRYALADHVQVFDFGPSAPQSSAGQADPSQEVE